MNKLILFTAFLMFIMIVSCSNETGKNYTIKIVKGVKVYKNSHKASVETLDISPKEIFSIAGIDKSSQDIDLDLIWPRFLDMDRGGNIYIVDTGTSSVKKITRDGAFIKSFGRFGNGPGEMRKPFMIAILDEIVFVADPGGRRMVTFDTNGNFIGNLILKAGLPGFLQTVGKDKFIGFLSKLQQSEKSRYIIVDLVLMDSQFKEIHTLTEYKRKFDPVYNDFLDRFTPYAVGEDKIFVAENSEEIYKINVFDFSGQLLYAIEKAYRKIPFNKDELYELNRTLEVVIKKFGIQLYFPIRVKFKRAINALYYDKQGRLLVASSMKRNQRNKDDFWVDVFKEGIFLKKIKLPIAKGHDFVKLYDEKIFFKGERIYYINEAEAVIRVFEY